MPSVDGVQRERRNQHLFREVNNRIHEIARSFETDEPVEFFCECGQTGCGARIVLTETRYGELIDGRPSALVAAEHVGSLDGRPVLAEYDRFVLAGQPTAPT